jgi:hypothetical protein
MSTRRAVLAEDTGENDVWMGSGTSLNNGNILTHCHQRISVSLQGQRNDNYSVTILSLCMLVSTYKLDYKMKARNESEKYAELELQCALSLKEVHMGGTFRLQHHLVYIVIISSLASSCLCRTFFSIHIH